MGPSWPLMSSLERPQSLIKVRSCSDKLLLPTVTELLLGKLFSGMNLFISAWSGLEGFLCMYISSYCCEDSKGFCPLGSVPNNHSVRCTCFLLCVS